MAVAQGDIVRCTAKMRASDGQAVQNVWYFRNEGLGAVVDTLVADDLGQLLELGYTEWRNLQPTTLEYESIEYYNLTGGYPISEEPWPTINAGASGGLDLPPANTLMIQFVTGIARTFGRKFIGTVTGTHVTDGNWNAGALTYAIDGASEYLGSMLGLTTGNVWLPGVVAAGGAFWGFLDVIVRDVPAVQKRRKQGRGI